MTSETVQGVIRAIRSHRERLERFCRSLSEEELERPVPGSTWVVKDFVSHLGAREGGSAWVFEATAAGRPEEAAGDIDAVKDSRVGERRKWPRERILGEGERNGGA